MKGFAATLAAAGMALALAACPLPQPVPDVARVDGGTVPATPHILPESALPIESIVFVKPDATCPAPGAQFSLTATVEDANTTESVEARWFVDYGLENNTGVQGHQPQVLPSDDPNDPLRRLDPFLFRPGDAQFAATGPVHVVEVVVSNGFLPLGDTTRPRNRAAQVPFETQTFRWVFQQVDASDPRGRCGNSG